MTSEATHGTSTSSAPTRSPSSCAASRTSQLRDGLVAWLCPGSLPLDSLPPDLVDALRSCLPEPTWHGRSARRVGRHRGGRVGRDRGPTPGGALPGPGEGSARRARGGEPHRAGQPGLVAWRRRPGEDLPGPGARGDTGLPAGPAARAHARPGGAAGRPRPTTWARRCRLAERRERAGRAEAVCVCWCAPSMVRTQRDTRRGGSYDGRQVMSPSDKPRLAGRQPSSRWGAPGEDPADPDLGGKRERLRSSFDDHDLPTTSDLRCLARR